LLVAAKKLKPLLTHRAAEGVDGAAGLAAGGRRQGFLRVDPWMVGHLIPKF
jgi:hypothetical protein